MHCPFRDSHHSHANCPTFANEGRVPGGLVVLVAQDEEGTLALDLPAHRRTHLHLDGLPKLPLLPSPLMLLVTAGGLAAAGHRLLVTAASAPGWSQVQWQVPGADPEGVRVLKREGKGRGLKFNTTNSNRRTFSSNSSKYYV